MTLQLQKTYQTVINMMPSSLPGRQKALLPSGMGTRGAIFCHTERVDMGPYLRVLFKAKV